MMLETSEPTSTDLSDDKILVNRSSSHDQEFSVNSCESPALSIIKALIYDHHKKLAPIEAKLKEL
ncbi:hypothetical protein SK128_002089, partial [Halocaridina rubra]